MKRKKRRSSVLRAVLFFVSVSVSVSVCVGVVCFFSVSQNKVLDVQAVSFGFVMPMCKF